MPLLEQRISRVWNLATNAAKANDLTMLTQVTLDEAERTLAIFNNRIDSRAPAYAMLKRLVEALASQPKAEA